MTKENDFPKKIQWHEILSSILSAWLAPAGIEVQSNIEFSSKIDILIRPCSHKKFTQEQRLHLADGLSGSKASRLLIEFKYTESFNLNALNQTLSYLHSYAKANQIPKNEMDAFLLCSKTPANKSLQRFSYKETNLVGVYHSDDERYAQVTLLVLNELSNEPQNIPLKCFASRKNELQKTFETIQQRDLKSINLSVLRLICGLAELLLRGEFDMNEHVITPGFLTDIGKDVLDNILQQMTISERLKGLDVKERLEGLDVSQIIPRLEKKKVLQQFEPNERLEGLGTKERLEGLDEAEILEYLKSMRH